MLMIAAITILSINGFAQENSKKEINTPHENSAITMYSCPMHKNVVNEKPGKCNECGMELKIKENTKQVFACSMKCEGNKTYSKLGKCPECGMNLKMKEAATATYACPMKCEADKTYSKPGKCPECGMNLKESKKTDDGHHH